MRLDPIEQRTLRAVGITLGLVAIIAVGIIVWARYQVYAEFREAEKQRAYETRMAELMDQELLAEGMSLGVVRATLGAPDSIYFRGEIRETWFYTSTRQYGPVLLRFEHEQLVAIERRSPPGGEWE
jgi:hypothetical protein